MPATGDTRDRAYAAGHFDLVIDGHKQTGYLKSIDGGWVKTNVMEEAVGSNQFRGKHSSVKDIEPISAEMGIAGSYDVLKWMQQSWNRQYARRHGQISHANLNLKDTFEHEFWDALLLEATIPSLDGSSKEPGWLKIKMQPERVETRRVEPKTKITSGMIEAGQKLWSTSMFRFTIDGVANMEKTAKIEAFTIKQGVKKHYLGQAEYPQIEPTKIDFPNLQGQIAMHHADALLDWYQQFVAGGENATQAQKTGSIEFLDPKTAKTIFRINLHDLGIVSLNVPGAAANQEQVKRLKFELYCGWMAIDIPSVS